VSEREVVRAAVIAAAAAGMLCALAHLHAEFLADVAQGRVAEPFTELVTLVPTWLLVALVYGVPAGLFCGILPGILGVGLWTSLERRWGTGRAIAALGVVVAAVAAAELSTAGLEPEDVPRVVAAAAICAGTAVHVLSVQAFAVDRGDVRTRRA